MSNTTRKQEGKCPIHMTHKSHMGWLKNNQSEILPLTPAYLSVTLVYRERDTA